MSHAMPRSPLLTLDSWRLQALLIANPNMASTINMSSNTYTASPLNNETSVMPPRRPTAKHCPSRIPVLTDAWETFSKKKVPFLAVPPEIHLKIFEFLHPVEAVCLSVVNKYIYNLAPPLSYTLSIGAPDSTNPLPRPSGCRHCLPLLFYPAHCELHFHLQSSQPNSIILPHLKFCPKCQKFTACQDGEISDRAEYCGKCGMGYKRRFVRGRRMIDLRRPGETQERLRKWYNEMTNCAMPGAFDLVRIGELQ